MKEEIWMPIEGLKDGFYDGFYEVSNLGRFKMLPRVLNCTNGQRLTKEKIVTGSNSHGYRRVILKKNRIRLQIDIHVLVARAFIPNPNGYPQVNHIDANRANNEVSNLEWCTAKENTKHAWENGIGTTKEARDANKIIVIDTNTGVFYDSAKDAYLNTNISRTQFARMLNGKIKNTTGMIYA